MITLIEGDLKACIASRTTGLIAQILLVMQFKVGWVDSWVRWFMSSWPCWQGKQRVSQGQLNLVQTPKVLSLTMGEFTG